MAALNRVLGDSLTEKIIFELKEETGPRVGRLIDRGEASTSVRRQEHGWCV